MPLPSHAKRRRFGVVVTLVAVAALALTIVVGRHGGEAQTLRPHGTAAPKALDPFLVELQERTFRFFWETANPRNGLVPDRYPTSSYSSIAAVGFSLTTYPVGVERGYITREQAEQRVLATLRFFANAPQGPEPRGRSGYKGLFYHTLGWIPEQGFLKYDWRGYNEAMLVYVLALGSPTFPVGTDAWTEWTSTYGMYWRALFGQKFLSFPPHTGG